MTQQEHRDEHTLPPGPFRRLLVALRAAGFRTAVFIVRRLSAVGLRGEYWSDLGGGVWVGGIPSARDLEQLQKLGVGAILTVSEEIKPPQQKIAELGLPQLCLEVPDRHTPSPEQLDRAVRWMGEQRAAGRQVYVHCAFGVGRSVLTAAAWLAASEEISGKEALARIRSKRKMARPNSSQREVFAAYCEARARPPKDGGAG